MHCVCLVSSDTEESVRSPGIGVIDSCETPYEFWELNPGPLQELLNHLIFEIGSFTQQECTDSARQGGHKLPVPSPPQLWVSELGPYAFSASTFLMEPSPQPLHLFLLS